MDHAALRTTRPAPCSPYVTFRSVRSGTRTRWSGQDSQAWSTPRSPSGHGDGYIFLDCAQNEEYDSTRVTAHEIGHVLGLLHPKSASCSKVMSGAGQVVAAPPS
ncbi:hypothetical protein CLM62_21465 [Streptomyces sp. SA15]|nr:hypothetical protein CLM62_21465 [Streptomyces sp. SA15]